MTAHERESPSIPFITVGDVAVRTEALRAVEGRRLAWAEFDTWTGRVLTHRKWATLSGAGGPVRHEAGVAA